MNVDEYSRYDATGLAELVRDREITAQELAKTARAACEKVNPDVNAVLEVYDDAENYVGPSDGVFAGVPFLRKDIGSGEAGRLQELGSRLFAGNVVERDAHYTRRAKMSGLNYIGRSAVPEIAIAGMTQSLKDGITRNPWNPDKSAGGSSGGAGAAVASGIVPMAHASDGGGSTRIPASWCGLVGLNPSRGRISGGPDNQDGLFGCAREFVLCRSMRDVAAMLDVLSGPEPGDPFVIRQPDRPYLEELGQTTGKLRVGVARTAWGKTPIEAEVLAEVDRVAAQLTELGHAVEEVRSPVNPLDVMVGIMGAFNLPLAGLRDVARKFGREIGPETLEPVTLRLLQRTEAMTPAEICGIFEALRRVRQQVGEATHQFDVLLTPTLPAPAQEHGLYSTMNQTLTAEEFISADSNVFTFVGTFNATGQPAINLPTGMSGDGLPIGVQIVGRFADEAVLIRLGRDIEEANDWRSRKPDIHVATAAG